MIAHFPTLDACLSEAFVDDSSSLVASPVPASRSSKDRDLWGRAGRSWR